ncbi:UNVERIFIED_CONTAM: hypothetical protein Scaly_1264200 [Sesamum calycinum]|uniref:Uncharacterized protein n=1 Tax=Sesamum calycinum TaxID=2727403 RepID=A0AAW2Q635_9LAMI
MDYAAADYEMGEVEEDMYFAGRIMGDTESDEEDDDEYNHLDNKITDTSAAEARKGKDIQGIPWERLSISRDKYRQTRLEQYRIMRIYPDLERVQRSCFLSLQLRNLVWSTSKHDVYLMSHYSIIHWSSLSSKKTEVLNVSGHVAPCEYLDRPGVSFCTRTTYDDNAITNAIEIYDGPSGAVHFTASNNDCGVRDFDMERFQLIKHFSYPWPVNHTSLSPDGKVIAIVGDNPDGMLVDSQTGKTVAPLRGHFDFSFASAWHPNGHIFATGNQDKTCRVWDSRNLSKSVAVLKGNLGAIRSIRFTSDGQFMAMAEPADFVHVYDVKNGYDKEQEIDFFGEISGVSFSPDTDSLFIGVWDRTYGSLLQYNRCRNYSYLDSLL